MLRNGASVLSGATPLGAGMVLPDVNYWNLLLHHQPSEHIETRLSCNHDPGRAVSGSLSCVNAEG